MKEKAKAFWTWFKNNNDLYKNFSTKYHENPEESEKNLNLLISQLQGVSEGLFAEVGGKTGAWELIVTPQGIKQYFADALELVSLAPSIDEWVVLGTKPALGSDFNFTMGEITLSPETITFLPLENDENPEEIAIRIYHKDYTDEEGPLRNAIIMGIYHGLDMTLGEISSTFDITYLEFSDKAGSDERTLPLAELGGYIKWKKTERQIHGVKFPEGKITLLKGEQNELPIMILINQEYRFYEYKRDYPYALLITLVYNDTEEDGFPKESMEEIYAIEDHYQDNLIKEDACHYLASISHNGNRKILFYSNSKEFLAQKIDQFQKEIKSHIVRYNIEYDPFWLRVEPYF